MGTTQSFKKTLLYSERYPSPITQSHVTAHSLNATINEEPVSVRTEMQDWSRQWFHMHSWVQQATPLATIVQPDICCNLGVGIWHKLSQAHNFFWGTILIIVSISVGFGYRGCCKWSRDTYRWFANSIRWSLAADPIFFGGRVRHGLDPVMLSCLLVSIDSRVSVEQNRVRNDLFGGENVVDKQELLENIEGKQRIWDILRSL